MDMDWLIIARMPLVMDCGGIIAVERMESEMHIIDAISQMVCSTLIVIIGIVRMTVMRMMTITSRHPMLRQVVVNLILRLLVI